MLQCICDRCRKETEAAHSHLRFETLSGNLLGLEISALFNGGRSESHHVCLECMGDMLCIAAQQLTVKRGGKVVSVQELREINKKLEQDVDLCHQHAAKLQQTIKASKEELRKAKSAAEVQIGALQERIEFLEKKPLPQPNPAVVQDLRAQLEASVNETHRLSRQIRELTVDFDQQVAVRQKLEAQNKSQKAELDELRAGRGG